MSYDSFENDYLEIDNFEKGSLRKISHFDIWLASKSITSKKGHFEKWFTLMFEIYNLEKRSLWEASLLEINHFEKRHFDKRSLGKLVYVCELWPNNEVIDFEVTHFLSDLLAWPVFRTDYPFKLCIEKHCYFIIVPLSGKKSKLDHLRLGL